MTTTETRAGGGLRGLLWLTWRQHRWFVLGSLAVTLAVAGVVVWFVHGLNDLTSVMEATRCDQGSQPPCSPGVFADRVFYNEYVDFPMRYVPSAFAAVVAVFIGAPLVAREYDQGTQFLIWSQDVTPVRWLVAKAGLLAAMTGVVAIVLGWLASLLSSAHRRIPQSVQVHSVWDNAYFEATAPLVLGYTLFGLALGIAAGALFRRTIPAMAATLIVFAGARVVISRPREYFLPPLRSVQPFSEAGTIKPPPGWGPEGNAVYAGFVDGAGNKLNWVEKCDGPGDWAARVACLRKNGATGYLHEWQPAERALPAQLIETGFFVLAAVLLFVIAWRLVRRRTSV